MLLPNGNALLNVHISYVLYVTSKPLLEWSDHYLVFIIGSFSVLPTTLKSQIGVGQQLPI
jgi:hypothetical protein